VTIAAITAHVAGGAVTGRGQAGSQGLKTENQVFDNGTVLLGKASKHGEDLGVNPI
jgi:hypothetical protein